MTATRAAQTSNAGNGRHTGRSDLRVLAVGTPPGLHTCVRRWTEDLVTEMAVVPDLSAAVRMLARAPWEVVMAVLGETPRAELAWWAEVLRRLEWRPKFIALAHHPSMDIVLEASKTKRFEVLSVPPQREVLRRILTRVREEGVETAVPLHELRQCTIGPEALVGESPAMLEVFKLIARVAPSTATVLIEGQSGTGKEVVARFIHAHSPIARGPFVPVNCASIPEHLLESELFGHERGAFTGAITRKLGSFQRADGGTLFLDEVAEMSTALQAKILRATQEREIQRVGGTDPIRVRVRLMAATNQDVNAAVRKGRLREDLYYRLAVVRIRLPLLAERGDDIALLTGHFVREFAAEYGKDITAISDRALALLREHRWVGNVRELRNALERAVIVATGDTLRVANLPEEIRETDGEPAHDRNDLTLETAESRHIRRVLEYTGGNMGRAADLLGIHRNTLTRKVRRFDG